MRLLGLAFLTAVAVVGCASKGVHGEWSYGSSHPGARLAIGGEVVLERTMVAPNLAGGVQAQLNRFHAYQWNQGFTPSYTTAGGACAYSDLEEVWPYQGIPAELDSVDVGDEILLSGPGIEGNGLSIPSLIIDAEEPVDPLGSPWRLYRPGDVIYGGADWSDQSFQDVDLESLATYALDLENDEGDPLELVMPRDAAAPNGIGTTTLELSASIRGDEGWMLTDDSIAYVRDGHRRETEVASVLFTDESGTPLVQCESVIDHNNGLVHLPGVLAATLPTTGQVQFSRYTHYLDAVGGLRMDLLAVRRYISDYRIE